MSAMTIFLSYLLAELSLHDRLKATEIESILRGDTSSCSVTFHLALRDI